jgi:hypothetical protein
MVRGPLDQLSGNTPPSFIEKPTNKTLKEQTTDFVQAVVTGYPFPAISWFKGARECHNGPKFIHEVDEKTGVVGLTIVKLKPDDEAKYTLVIKNSSGEEKCTFSLFVKCNFAIPHISLFIWPANFREPLFS